MITVHHRTSFEPDAILDLEKPVNWWIAGLGGSAIEGHRDRCAEPLGLFLFVAQSPTFG